MKFKILLFLLFNFLSSISVAQVKTDSTWTAYRNTDLSLLVGYQIHKNHFAEIGLGIRELSSGRYHYASIIYGISNEFKINDDFVWGLKAGIWIESGIGYGINVVNYTDFESNTLRLRPEVGIGIFGFYKMVYGYNLAIINKDFKGINTHTFSVIVPIKLKRIKEVREEIPIR